MKQLLKVMKALGDGTRLKMLKLFVFALGHCVLILAAGTFTGFAESYLASKGVANFSAWTKRVSGALILGAGGYVAYITLGL